MSKNQLGGVLPSAWTSMTALRHLDLSNNTGVSGSLPSEWASLTTLSELKLQGAGSIAGTVPLEWNNMTALTKLDISRNTGLTGEIPELLHNQFLIGELELRDDGTSLVPPTKPERKCKHGLDLYLPYLVRKHGPSFSVDCFLVNGASPVNGTIPEWIGVFTGLTTLNLFRNNMVGTLPTGLGLLTKMTQL
jgi:hypothetical protein